MSDTFINFLKNKKIEDLQFLTKLIAMSIRNEMEDFHVEHLSDKQMSELNPLIRKGIYTALYSLSTSLSNPNARDYLTFTINSIPNYWEDVFPPEELMQKTLSPSAIKSKFLQEQMTIGNINFDEKLNGIRISGSYSFLDVKDPVKHRNKIRYYLLKEGFKYNRILDTYIVN